jgi:hypothetical protein
MKNTYLTSYFPLISIIFYSVSLAAYFEMYLLEKLETMGIYQGMLAGISLKGEMKLSIFFLVSFFFFMLFSALKLLADTMIELSLLFFSKDIEGHNLNQIRRGTMIYLISGALSLLFVHHLIAILLIFITATAVYFIYFIYKISQSLSKTGLVGIMFFHVIVWFSFIAIIALLCLKLYNSILSSLPV